MAWRLGDKMDMSLFLLVILLATPSPSLSEPSGKLGCRFSPVCDQDEVCAEDKLFGTCTQRSASYLPSYALDPPGLKRLKATVQYLLDQGFAWEDKYAQVGCKTIMGFSSPQWCVKNLPSFWVQLILCVQFGPSMAKQPNSKIDILRKASTEIKLFCHKNGMKVWKEAETGHVIFRNHTEYAFKTLKWEKHPQFAQKWSDVKTKIFRVGLFYSPWWVTEH